MEPRFRQKVRDTVAKRAAYMCSNPDCGVSTVGPNSAEEKVTLIGEAAHIRGANPGSARYDSEMSDLARSEITNAIWLCRNCHGAIDRDETRYPPELLYCWREDHEHAVAQQLGSRSDRALAELQSERLSSFDEYPAIVRRICVDQPPGWEFRLAAELLRARNREALARLHDLRDGVYVRPLTRVAEEELLAWTDDRIAEMSSLIGPFMKLFERLNASFGEPGEPGDLHAIHDVCTLFSENVENMLAFEERVHFARVDEEYEKLLGLMKGQIAAQADRIEELPDILDEVASLAVELEESPPSEPQRIEQEIVFELPDDWEKQFSRELKKLERNLRWRSGDDSDETSGVGAAILLLLVLPILAWACI